MFTRRGVVSINMIVCLLPNASDVTGIVLEQKHAATATILVNDRLVFADRCFYASNNGVLHYNVFIRRTRFLYVQTTRLSMSLNIIDPRFQYIYV